MLIKNLVTREAVIKAMLEKKKASERLIAKIDEYRELLDQLPAETEKLEQFQNTLAGFEAAVEELLPDPAPVQPPTILQVAAKSEPLREKEEKLFEHDGKVATFRRFLARFNDLVGNNTKFNDTQKQRLLCSVVYPPDGEEIADLGYDKAIAVQIGRASCRERV